MPDAQAGHSVGMEATGSFRLPQSAGGGQPR